MGLLSHSRKRTGVRPGRLAPIEPGSKSVVYALLARDSVPLVKFGTSKQLKRRLAGLRRKNPVPIDVIGSVTGSYTLESLLHSCLEDCRVFGEWYRYAGRAKLVARLIRMNRPDLIYQYLNREAALI